MPLGRGRYPMNNPDWLLAGQPSSTFRHTMHRRDIISDTAALTTQVMTSWAIPLEAGDVFNTITFLSGATAAGTPTNQWAALYSDDATPALVLQSADRTNSAWAANAAKAFTLSSTARITRSGVYYVSLMVKATTPPSVAGITLENAAAAGAVTSGQKVLAQTSGAALTDTAPATIATPTTVAVLAYAALTLV